MAPINRVWLFGSYARNEARPESDIDIVIEPALGLTLMGMSSFKARVEKSLGTTVDVATKNGLFPHARAGFERDGMMLYERA